MKRLLILGISLISTVPLYAQREQQNIAKLKADARNLVGIIGGDKTKTQTYCQIEDLSDQLIQAAQEEDRKKAKALERKIAELNKKMGPEFAALIDIEKHVDLDSRDGQEIDRGGSSLNTKSCHGKKTWCSDAPIRSHHPEAGTANRPSSCSPKMRRGLAANIASRAGPQWPEAHMSISRTSPAAAQQPSCSPKMRREGLQPTWRSCRS